MSENEKNVAEQVRVKRPLSPHLQVYKPQITSMSSIGHRIAAMIMLAAAFVMAFGFAAATLWPDFFHYTTWVHDTIFGQIILVGITFAAMYHICNGIRHLFWDVGRCFDLDNVALSFKIIILVSIGLTGLVYWVAMCDCSGVG